MTNPESSMTDTSDPRTSWKPTTRNAVHSHLREALKRAKMPPTCFLAHNHPIGKQAQSIVAEMLSYRTCAETGDTAGANSHLRRVESLFKSFEGQKPHLWDEVGPVPKAFGAMIMLSEFTALPPSVVTEARVTLEDLDSMVAVAAAGRTHESWDMESYATAIGYLDALAKASTTLEGMAMTELCAAALSRIGTR